MRGDFNLSNKFEYGLDQKGAILAGKIPDDPKQLMDCHNTAAWGHHEREEFKEKIERQNFTIQHDKILENTETKHIGTHGGKGIANIIN